MRALVVLCAAGASALTSYDAAALRRALGAAKPLRNGAVIFRREWREKAGDDAAADAVYDALTRGRGPPDLVCLSYTHDEDYEEHKPYPPGKKPKRVPGG